MGRGVIAKNLALLGLLPVIIGLTIACSQPGLTPVFTPTPEPTEAPTPVPTLEATSTPVPSPTSETLPESTAAVEEQEFLKIDTTLVKLNSQGEPSVLAEGDQLASCLSPDGKNCDLYGLYFEPHQDAHIYALQQDSSGQIFPLFPNEKYSPQKNPVTAGAKVWVPTDIEHWLALDETTGQETIFLVAGRGPITELENLVAQVIQGGPAGGKAAADLVSLVTGMRGPQDLPVERKVSVELPNGQTRDLATLVLTATGEDDFVFTVSFEHVTPSVLN